MTSSDPDPVPAVTDVKMASPKDPEAFHSGFVAVFGRPNVGKSSLINAIVGQKVSITSANPNTTRTAVRGIRNGPGFQIVFVDTPGLHKPKSPLGTRLNETAVRALEDVDCCLLVVDATAPIGRGDRYIAERLPSRTVVVVNKLDIAPPLTVFRQLERAAGELALEDPEFFPVSARSGKGVPELVEHLVSRLPPGPAYYPEEMIRDVPEAVFIAELVREQLLARVHEELPHSLACRVLDIDWPYVRCEILVERESQKPIIVGKRGSVLKAVGIAARAQLPPGTYLDLRVRVEPNWQRRMEVIEKLGY